MLGAKLNLESRISFDLFVNPALCFSKYSAHKGYSEGDSRWTVLNLLQLRFVI